MAWCLYRDAFGECIADGKTCSDPVTGVGGGPRGPYCWTGNITLFQTVGAYAYSASLMYSLPTVVLCLVCCGWCPMLAGYVCWARSGKCECLYYDEAETPQAGPSVPVIIQADPSVPVIISNPTRVAGPRTQNNQPNDDDEVGTHSASRAPASGPLCTLFFKLLQLALSIAVIGITLYETLLISQLQSQKSAFGANYWQSATPLTLMFSLDFFKTIPSLSIDCGGCGACNTIFELVAFNVINLIQLCILIQLAGEPRSLVDNPPEGSQYGSDNPERVGVTIALSCCAIVVELLAIALRVAMECKDWKNNRRECLKVRSVLTLKNAEEEESIPDPEQLPSVSWCLRASRFLTSVFDVVVAALGCWFLLYPTLRVYPDGWYASTQSSALDYLEFGTGDVIKRIQWQSPMSNNTLVYLDAVSSLTGLTHYSVKRAEQCSEYSYGTQGPSDYDGGVAGYEADCSFNDGGGSYNSKMTYALIRWFSGSQGTIKKVIGPSTVDGSQSTSFAIT